jgi:hypothetical protein
LSINHFSGCGGGAYPINVASMINKEALKLEWIIGIKIFDFPGEVVIDHVINQNFKIIHEEYIENS